MLAAGYLSQADYTAVLGRQQTLTNKVDVRRHFGCPLERFPQYRYQQQGCSFSRSGL